MSDPTPNKKKPAARSARRVVKKGPSTTIETSKRAMPPTKPKKDRRPARDTPAKGKESKKPSGAKKAATLRKKLTRLLRGR